MIKTCQLKTLFLSLSFLCLATLGHSANRAQTDSALKFVQKLSLAAEGKATSKAAKSSLTFLRSKSLLQAAGLYSVSDALHALMGNSAGSEAAQAPLDLNVAELKAIQDALMDASNNSGAKRQVINQLVAIEEAMAAKPALQSLKNYVSGASFQQSVQVIAGAGSAVASSTPMVFSNQEAAEVAQTKALASIFHNPYMLASKGAFIKSVEAMIAQLERVLAKCNGAESSSVACQELQSTGALATFQALKTNELWQLFRGRDSDCLAQFQLENAWAVLNFFFSELGKHYEAHQGKIEMLASQSAAEILESTVKATATYMSQTLEIAEDSAAAIVKFCKGMLTGSCQNVAAPKGFVPSMCGAAI